MPTLTVQGMSCEHCVKAITRALEALPEVTAVQVDLATGKATWEGKDDAASLARSRNAVEEIGFDLDN